MLKPTVFISYKRGHEPTAEAVQRIETSLRAAGFDVMRDVSIEAGSFWSNDLYRWLMECSAAVAIIGEEAAQSEWCRREWWFLRERHRTNGIPVIPICLTGSFKSAGILDDLQGIHISDDFDHSILPRLQGLRAARPSAESYLAAHHAWLRWQFADAPLWGREPFSLRDIYAETDCGRLTWSEIVDEKARRDPFKDDEQNGGRHNLIDTVMEFLSNPEFREPIVVQGAPGCGKSAFALRLANELLTRGTRPILVRFRDFRLTTIDSANELIEDALRIGPVEEEPPPPNEPIVSDDMLRRVVELGRASISQLVFILDGWDEVSLTGNTSYQAQLQSWLPRIREYFIGHRGPPIRLVLTGRPSSEVRTSGVLRRETPVLTVRQLTPDRLKGLAEAIDMKLRLAREVGGKAPWSLDLSRLDSIFGQYERWFAAPDKTTAQSMEVVGSPLLAFLTFRTIADWEDDPTSLVAEPTALYKALVDITVKYAARGRDDGLQGTVHRGGELLRRLLHKIAGTITVLGREAVSFSELNSRFEDDSAELVAWRTDRGLRDVVNEAIRDNVLHELMINFFFKGGNTNLGCEFLHKSFREYLFAEAVVAVLKDISGNASGPLPAPKIEYWQDFADGTSQFKASRALARLLAPQWLTFDVRAHILWLLKTEIEAEPQRWQWIGDLLLDVYIWWAEGVHLRPQPETRRGAKVWLPAFINEMLEDALPFDPTASADPIRTVALDAHMGDALMQITAAVHANLSAPREEKSDRSGLRANYARFADGRYAFAPGGNGYFGPLCHRINAANWRPTGIFPGDANLPAVDLSQEDCSMISFDGTIMVGARLQQANLGGTWFNRVDLRRAIITEAGLQKARFEGCDLTDADLTRSDMRESYIRGVILSKAGLKKTNLEGAVLSHCEMIGARLTAANLHGSYFRRTSLVGVDLDKANLNETIFVRCVIGAEQEIDGRSVIMFRCDVA
jgi:uncharacterized protein YjbI with pentapeptide repeats